MGSNTILARAKICWPHLKSFFKDAEQVLRERTDATLLSLKLSWQYHVQRANVWNAYKELAATPYNEEYGCFEGNIDPEDVNAEENYLKVLETSESARVY